MTENEKDEIFNAMWAWKLSMKAGSLHAWDAFAECASRHGIDAHSARRVLEDATWDGACRELDALMDKSPLRRMMERAVLP